ncbi:MAG: carbohydrate-binding domain-containing protein [Ruminococcus sp.]|nr:carbohydrate-binding domain-containing protein [Ruminococcus sp.]
MKHQVQRIAWATAMLMAALSLTTGCSPKPDDNTNTQVSQTSSEQQLAEDSTQAKLTETTSISTLESSSRAVYDHDDIAAEYDSFDAEITFNGNTASVSGNKDNVAISGSNITITAGGVYYLSGDLTDGQLNIIGSEKVKLYLDGVSIKNSNGSAIVCTNEKRTIITLAKGSENMLTDGSSYSISEDDSAAAIYAKDKLTINGSGILTVNSNASDGIVSKDDLKITGGTININAVNNGVKGTDSVSICGGLLNITSGNDAIKSTKSDNIEKGWIAIDGGEINIIAGGDGIQSENTLEITAGKLNITTNGEIDTSSSNENEFGGMFGGHGGHGGFDHFDDHGDFGGRNEFGFNNHIGDMYDTGENMTTAAITTESTTDNNTNEETSSLSSKGIKSGNAMTVTGGTIQINSTDHCVHSSGDMNISGASINLLSSMAKGISSHGELTISGDETLVTIEKCTEGIESKSVMNINGGNIRILDASDDGLNTGGTVGSDHTMNINGGTIYVNSSSDGIDSNGDVNFNGGLLIVSGPVSGADGSIDGDGTMSINGGTILGLSSRGMMEYPAGCMITTSVNASAGDMISVLDSSGNLIITIKTNKVVSDVIYADNTGDTMASYKLVVGGTFDGALCEDGWSVDGKIENGSECTWSRAETAGSGMQGGMGRFGGGEKPEKFDGKDDQMHKDMENMTPPGGFGGERPDGRFIEESKE